MRTHMRMILSGSVKQAKYSPNKQSDLDSFSKGMLLYNYFVSPIQKASSIEIFQSRTTVARFVPPTSEFTTAL